MALLASVCVPIIIAIIQAVAHKLKPASARERFSNNVVTRVERGAFDRDETHYVINPHFIRKRKDGSFEVPGLGSCCIRQEHLSDLRKSNQWLDCIDMSGISDSGINLIPMGSRPSP